MAEAAESTAGAGRKHTQTSIYGLFNTLIQNCVERERRVLRSTMEWPSTARRSTDELSRPRKRAPSVVRVGVLGSLSLSLSHGTCDGSAPPVVEMHACPGVLLGADDSTLDQRKEQGIEEGEAEEAITRCAGPPAAALSMSAGTRHTPEEVWV